MAGDNRLDLLVNELQDDNDLFLRCFYRALAHVDDALCTPFEHAMFTALFSSLNLSCD